MFLQIGDRAIAIEHITSIFFDAGRQTVWISLDVLAGDQATVIIFDDNDYKAFMNWWEHAEVYKT